ncbi:unnamed protein product [marine sediment metagenome]|uniref:Uncharacterized protein n=1 Tax=marine sediment metagenome TaxID=412755 RepID=X1NAB8_9ZZZZ
MGTKLEKTTNEKLKELIDAIEAKLDNDTHGLVALKELIDAIEAKLDNDTHGLVALKELIDALIDAIEAKQKVYKESGTDTQLTVANGMNEIIIKTFDKATYGTGEIKAFKIDLDVAAVGFQTNAAGGSTIKIRAYEKIDEVNYRMRTDDGISYTWTQGVAGDKVAEIDEISFSEDMQIRAVLSQAPTADITLKWLGELIKNMEV